MHFSPSPAEPACPGWPSPGLVVAAPAGLSEAAARHWLVPLAQLLGLRLLPAPSGADANLCLAQLAEAPPGWLLPLAMDPAADLADQGCWAEVLGAWRQPLLLLLPAELAGAGPARAYSALLQQEAVPLVGLVQLGDPWQPERRRREGLPWLGWFPEPGSDADEARRELLLQVMRRWRLSSARDAGPDCPAA